MQVFALMKGGQHEPVCILNHHTDGSDDFQSFLPDDAVIRGVIKEPPFSSTSIVRSWWSHTEGTYYNLIAYSVVSTIDKALSY